MAHNCENAWKATGIKKAFNVSHFMAIKPLNLWAKHQNTQ